MNLRRDDDWEEFVDALEVNLRAHAGYFSWVTDRDIEELGVVQALHESLTRSGRSLFHSFEARGRGNDPPDCEAQLCVGGRIGIEVTELVDGKSLAAQKFGGSIPAELYSGSELFRILVDRIAKKDKVDNVKGGPYDQYILIIYCDEPRICDFNLIEYVRHATFPRTAFIDRVFLLFSYSPWEGCCPYIDLNLRGH